MSTHSEAVDFSCLTWLFQSHTADELDRCASSLSIQIMPFGVRSNLPIISVPSLIPQSLTGFAAFIVWVFLHFTSHALKVFTHSSLTLIWWLFAWSFISPIFLYLFPKFSTYVSTFVLFLWILLKVFLLPLFIWFFLITFTFFPISTFFRGL